MTARNAYQALLKESYDTLNGKDDGWVTERNEVFTELNFNVKRSVFSMFEELSPFGVVVCGLLEGWEIAKSKRFRQKSVLGLHANFP